MEKLGRPEPEDGRGVSNAGRCGSDGHAGTGVFGAAEIRLASPDLSEGVPRYDAGGEVYSFATKAASA